MTPPAVAFVAAAISFALTAAFYAWLAQTSTRAVPDAVTRRGVTAGLWLSAVAAIVPAIVVSSLVLEPPAFRAAIGQLRSCETIPARFGEDLKMTLDAPPREIWMSFDRNHREGLREACREHATVKVTYRVGRHKPWVHAISFADGREIVTEEEAARKQRSEERTAAALGGVFGGLSLGLLVGTLGWRRRALHAGDPPSRQRA